MTAIDHARLLAEIDEEVRSRRASGELPAELERKLDIVFARYAPVHFIDGDFGQVIERVKHATFIDPLAPTDSARPGVPFVKRLVRKAILWVVRHVAQQVSGFAEAITKAVILLGHRVDAIEEALPTLGPTSAGVDLGPELPDATHWAEALPPALGLVQGRVLVAGGGAAVLVGPLEAAGLDAYAADVAGVAGADDGDERVRDDAALEHLRKVAPSGLGAIILGGCLDRLPLPAKREALAMALDRLAPGGRLVVIGADPLSWVAGQNAVAADLAPGRPLAPATWTHLLAERGCTGTTELAGPREGLDAMDDAPPALAANLARLDALLFPPRSWAILTTR